MDFIYIYVNIYSDWSGSLSISNVLNTQNLYNAPVCAYKSIYYGIIIKL